MLAGMGASINVFRMVIIFLRIQSLAALSKLSIHGMHVLGIQFFFSFLWWWDSTVCPCRCSVYKPVDMFLSMCVRQVFVGKRGKQKSWYYSYVNTIICKIKIQIECLLFGLIICVVLQEKARTRMVKQETSDTRSSWSEVWASSPPRDDQSNGGNGTTRRSIFFLLLSCNI